MQSNIRPTDSATLFFIDADSAALIEWLEAEKGMEKEPPESVGRHWAILHAEGMEVIIDPPSSLGSATIKCYGRKKLDAAAWVNEYRNRGMKK